MISAIRLGNFKAFKETQEIPIRPLTLLFGPNSSGKSTVIQGLLFAHTARNTGNLDVHRTKLGGGFVDLGGFRQFVHSQDTSLTVEIGIGTTKSEITSLTGTIYEEDGSHSVQGPDEYDYLDKYISDHNALASINNWTICTTFGINEDLSCVNIKSKLLADNADCIEYYNLGSKGLLEPSIANILDKYRQMPDFNYHTWSSTILAIGNNLFPYLCIGDYLDPSFFEETIVYQFRNGFQLYKDILWIISSALITCIDNSLNYMLYLGPTRYYPERQEYDNEPVKGEYDPSGLKTWLELITNLELQNNVNAWLKQPGRLRSPYQLDVDFTVPGKLLNEIKRKDRKDLQIFLENHPDVHKGLILIDKRKGNGARVSLRDVGFGLSQVLPVIFTIFGNKNRMIAIEQPELHLHPALQAELADALIYSAKENKNTLILETHSEHLLLRIMRRIRETSSGKLPDGATPLHPEDVIINYIDVSEDSSGSTVTQIEINENGDLIDGWPGGFFPERLKELF